MTGLSHQIATEVIRVASREKPADAALREILRQRRAVSVQDAAEACKAVFAYYRWLGWTQGEWTVEARLRIAQRLADRFKQNPNSFTVGDLRGKAVPNWVFAEVSADDAWLRSLQSEPSLWLRAKRGQGRALAKRLAGAKLRDNLLPDAIDYTGDEDLFKTPAFRAGEFEIQDFASQAVGFLCDPQPGETWWDACAGEGGKTLHLSDLMANKGLIWASDRAEWRLQRLKRRAARAKAFNYRVALWDGGAKLPTKTKFDGVLVDAPCSGVGTWQRNPHARWTTSLEDVQELALLQQRLLAHVAPSVKPGGKLVYVVCTLTRAETEETVRQFNETQPGFEPRVLPELHGVKGEWLKGGTGMMLWPEKLGGNGMFLTAWRRMLTGSVGPEQIV